jgi:hypothetical protein
MAIVIGSALDINNPHRHGVAVSGPRNSAIAPEWEQIAISFGIDPHAIGFH